MAAFCTIVCVHEEGSCTHRIRHPNQRAASKASAPNDAERRAIVEETLLPRASASRVARRHDVNANQVFYVPLPEGISRRTAGRGSDKSPSDKGREGTCCGGPAICLLHWFPVEGIVYGQNEPRFLCTHTLVVGGQFLEEERPFSSQHGLDAFAKSSKCGIVIKVYLHQIR